MQVVFDIGTDDLAKVAISEAALEVLNDAASRPKINYCMVDEIKDANASVEKRRAARAIPGGHEGALRGTSEDS